MDAYTISKLASDAGVSVHVVRDYVLRGLLHPAQRTESGYGLYDTQALQRLCFVRAAFEAGIGLGTLTRLCRAWDAEDGAAAAECLADLRQSVERRRQSLMALEAQLAELARSTSERSP
ncbi:MAG: mercuric resistance transcriptional repressor protein MerD [Betaproteobacteria bacterium]|nr:mercuric resistance transcriptional repressor protein MerD [Betaproteobacteria bacterium]